MTSDRSSKDQDIEEFLDSLALTEQTVSTEGYEEGYAQGEKKARRAALNVCLVVTKFAARRKAFEVLLQHTLKTLSNKEEENKANGLELTTAENHLKTQLQNNLEVLRLLDYDVDRESKITRLISSYFKVAGHHTSCLAMKHLLPTEEKSSPYQF